MDSKTFHPPSQLERAFLRVVTHGHTALQRQIESCEISAYDVTGYYDVRVLTTESIEPVLTRPIDGPLLDLSDAHAPQPAIVQIGEPAVYSSTRPGRLTSVEVCSIGDGYIVDPTALFVDAFDAKSSRLKFRSTTS